MSGNLAASWATPGRRKPDSVRCLTCGWKTLRLHDAGRIGGYGVCPRLNCDGTPRERILRKAPTMAEKRAAKAKAQLKEVAK